MCQPLALIQKKLDTSSFHPGRIYTKINGNFRSIIEWDTTRDCEGFYEVAAITTMTLPCNVVAFLPNVLSKVGDTYPVMWWAGETGDLILALICCQMMKMDSQNRMTIDCVGVSIRRNEQKRRLEFRPKPGSGVLDGTSSRSQLV